MNALTAHRLSVNVIVAGMVAVMGCSSEEEDSGASGGANGAVGGALHSTDSDASRAGSGGTLSRSTTNGRGGKEATGGHLGTGGSGRTSTGGNTARGGTSSTSGTSTGGTSTGGTSTGGTSTGGTSGTRVDCGAVATDFSCVTDKDCCLVGNGCGSVLYLTNQSQKDAVQRCLDASGMGSPCPACLAAPVQLSCVNRRCVGTVMDRKVTGYSSAFSAPHCGALPLPSGSGGAGSGSTVPVTSLAPLAAEDVLGGSNGIPDTASSDRIVDLVGGAGNSNAPIAPPQNTVFTCSSQ